MFFKIFLLFYILIYLSGCSSKPSGNAAQLTLPKPAETSTTVFSVPAVKSEVLPELSAVKKLPAVDSVNDLVDNFHFDGDGVKVRLVVKNDRACFVWVKPSTPDAPGELVMESLSREKLGLWRGKNTQKLFTQSAPNQMDVYTSNEELQSSYTNPVMTKELSSIPADYKERASSFDVLLGRALNKSKVGRVIYTNQCAQLANFYYREELPPLTREEKQEFEREREQIEKSN